MVYQPFFEVDGASRTPSNPLAWRAYGLLGLELGGDIEPGWHRAGHDARVITGGRGHGQGAGNARDCAAKSRVTTAI